MEEAFTSEHWIVRIFKVLKRCVHTSIFRWDIGYGATLLYRLCQVESVQPKLLEYFSINLGIFPFFRSHKLVEYSNVPTCRIYVGTEYRIYCRSRIHHRNTKRHRSTISHRNKKYSSGWVLKLIELIEEKFECAPLPWIQQYSAIWEPH